MDLVGAPSLDLRWRSKGNLIRIFRLQIADVDLDGAPDLRWRGNLIRKISRLQITSINNRQTFLMLESRVTENPKYP